MRRQLGELQSLAGLLAGLPRFLRQPPSLAQARAGVARRLARRVPHLLALLESVFRLRPQSPYLRLLRHAGIGLEDARGLVEQSGLEDALQQLAAAGVMLTVDEFKGRCLVERGSLRFQIEPGDLDNPSLGSGISARTGGSRGGVHRVKTDLRLLAAETHLLRLFLHGHGLEGWPIGLLRPVPPANAGLANLLRYAGLGQTVERWFSPTHYSRDLLGLKSRLMNASIRAAAWGLGTRLPAPEVLARRDWSEAARWLAACVERGQPGHLDAPASAAVEVCRSAAELGLDIRGSFLRVGGEPFTSAKAGEIEAVGAHATTHYSSAETGKLALGCADPRSPDDAHVLDDKLALIERPHRLADGAELSALLVTSLLPGSPKLALNVQLGDYGLLEERSCSCPLGAVGLRRHIRQIGSFDKLTSGGVHFLGSELHRLVEVVLPGRFGGSPIDFQLVDEARDTARLTLRISPQLGPVDSERARNCVYETLSQVPGGALMVEMWQHADTLQVARAAPLRTAAGKILALHVARVGESAVQKTAVE